MRRMSLIKGKAKSDLPTLYKKVLEVFVEYSINRKLRFKQARHILSWLFHIPKRECWEVLKELENFGVVKIISNHFIELNITKANFFLLKLHQNPNKQLR